MYLSIKNFSNVKSPEAVIKAVETQLTPILKGLPGFNSFYAAKLENGTLATVGMYDTKANADSANERAMGWVKQKLAEHLPGEPVSMRGEILVAAGIDKVFTKSA